MEDINYSLFSKKLRQKFAGQRVATSATVEITRRCPLTCAHCYNNLPMGDTTARNSELTYEEHCRILDELADLGVLWLLYTGGEIFARSDFVDIYAYAKKKGFVITLFTNGTLITPKIADFLAQFPPFGIEITLYGRTKQTYEQLTGVAGSYEKCMWGIDLLLERDLPLTIKTVAVTINKHEIPDIELFVQEKLGKDLKFDAMMSPRIDCSQSPLAVRLTPEEVVELDLRDQKRVSEWQRLADSLGGPVHTGAYADKIYLCGAGANSFSIDPEGYISICSSSHVDKYSWRQGSIQQGWEEFLLDVRQKKMTMHTKCLNCGIKAMCGMCPAMGELESGHPEKPVDFLCEVAHLRAYAFDFDVLPHGACECCKGGDKHLALQHSVTSLKKRLNEQQKGHFGQSLKKYLPVLAQPSGASASGSCATGGCLSCS